MMNPFFNSALQGQASILRSEVRSAKYLLRKVLANDKITGARINSRMPLTLNPGVTAAASEKQIPFTTRENKPSVKKLTGRVSSDRIGFTKALTKPIATPAIKADGNDAMLTPGSRMSTTSRLRAVDRTTKKYPNIFSSSITNN